MVKMTNLPRDLAEEILCRIPVTSLRRVRSTCKNWETLLKDDNFTKKQLAQAAAAAAESGEFLAILMINCRLCLISVNLDGIHNDFDPSIRPSGNLISLNDSDKLDMTRLYHCEGLLLCVTEDYTKLVVWNPFTGQTRWVCVEPRSVHHRVVWYGHTLGYDKSTHKILRYMNVTCETPVYEIYNVNSNSWRVLDVTPDWEFKHTNYGQTVKGNTYWYATDMESPDSVGDFLLCFDFTREKFAPRLPLPFSSYSEDCVTLSSVRDEQLAVLFQNIDTCEMEIWVTTKIDPNAVSWRKFLVVVDMKPLTGYVFSSATSFILIEEDKRAVVVFGEYQRAEGNHYMAFFIGENGYFREVALGERLAKVTYPHAFSYVPSSVQA